MTDVIWNRKLMKTKWNSLLGLVPESAEPEDIICILFGCSVPVVLHEIEGQGGAPGSAYKLVGESYLHGMMDGEAFELQKEEKEEFEKRSEGWTKDKIAAQAKIELRMRKQMFELS